MARPGTALTAMAPGAAGRLDMAAPSVRYLVVATLVRMADGGSTAALVTVAISPHRGAGGASGGSGGSGASAGLLTALLTAPHLLGPLAAAPLARATDPRRVLAVAFAGFGICLALCGVLLDHRQLIPAAVAACTAGCAGPLITGGLSAQATADTTGGRHHAGAPAGEKNLDARRAEAWDAATYGLGATIGPTVVAGIVVLTSPVVSVTALGGAAVVSAILALGLPTARTQGTATAKMPVRKVFTAITAVSVLRRTLCATVLAAFGTGGLLVAAVVFGDHLGGHTSNGALLAAAFGVGSLAGSGVLVMRPMRGEPETAMLALLAATGLLIALSAAAPDLVLAAIGFACTGAVSAAQFTASLAVRSTYAPPGTRAHVFVTMAGLKMGCSALGSALAGAVLSLGPRPTLLMISSLVLAGAAVATALKHL